MHFKRGLITGGAGFIGTHLARDFLAAGTVREIVSLDVAAPQHPVEGVRYVTHDVRQPFDRAAPGAFDLVINLAAVHRTPGHPDHAYFDTNIAGAINTVGFCERRGVRHLVFTSSISVYGPSETPLDEGSPPNPNHAYGRSKWLAEEIHREWYARGAERKLVIARPAIVFGEGENGNYTRLAMLLKRGIFVFPGRKDTRKAGGYVRELVATIEFALARSDNYYLYNFAFPACPTTEEICAALTEVAAVRPPLGTLPLAILEAGGFAMEALNAVGLRNGINRDRIRKLVNSTNVHPGHLLRDHYRYRYTLRSAFADWFGSDRELAIPLREGQTRGVPVSQSMAPKSAEIRVDRS